MRKQSIKINPKILEYQVGRDLKDHLVQPFLAASLSGKNSPAPGFAESQICPVVENPSISMGWLFQGLIVTDQNYPPVTNWKLPRSNLCTLSIIFSKWLLVRREALPSLQPPFQYWNVGISLLQPIQVSLQVGSSLWSVPFPTHFGNFTAEKKQRTVRRISSLVYKMAWSYFEKQILKFKTA